MLPSAPSPEHIDMATGEEFADAEEDMEFPESGKGPRRCSYCGSLSTPMWRHGPAPYDTLCNSCGVKWRRGKILPELPHGRYRPATGTKYSRRGSATSEPRRRGSSKTSVDLDALGLDDGAEEEVEVWVRGKLQRKRSERTVSAETSPVRGAGLGDSILVTPLVPPGTSVLPPAQEVDLRTPRPLLALPVQSRKSENTKERTDILPQVKMVADPMDADDEEDELDPTAPRFSPISPTVPLAPLLAATLSPSRSPAQGGILARQGSGGVARDVASTIASGMHVKFVEPVTDGSVRSGGSETGKRRRSRSATPVVEEDLRRAPLAGAPLSQPTAEVSSPALVFSDPIEDDMIFEFGAENRPLPMQPVASGAIDSQRSTTPVDTLAGLPVMPIEFRDVDSRAMTSIPLVETLQNAPSPNRSAPETALFAVVSPENQMDVDVEKNLELAPPLPGQSQPQSRLLSATSLIPHSSQHPSIADRTSLLAYRLSHLPPPLLPSVVSVLARYMTTAQKESFEMGGEVEIDVERIGWSAWEEVERVVGVVGHDGRWTGVEVEGQESSMDGVVGV
ncbi:hypothetical protein HDU93_003096 [Gonapodya sp. JEL0774]|nr:hypothetical protein HDU93_003096 [Gonapodya sp. JEL0774]